MASDLTQYLDYALIAMLLACTPGNRKPVAITVASAKIHAYQRCPMAFSM